MTAFAGETGAGGGGGIDILNGNVVGPSNANRVVELSGDSITKIVTQDSGVSIKQTQGGTVGVPANENPLRWLPRDPAKAEFGINLTGTNFLGTIDTVIRYGYNPDSADINAEPRAFFAIEQDYDDGLGVGHKIEMYWQISANDASLAVRPIFVNYNRTSGDSNVVVSFRGANSGFNVTEAVSGDPVYAATHVQQAWYVNGTQLAGLDGVGGFTVSGGFPIRVGAAPLPTVGYIRIGGNATDGVTFRNFLNTRNFYGMFSDGEDLSIGHPVRALSPDAIAMKPGKGVQFFENTGDFGGGIDVIGIAVANTAPTGNPTSGFVLFVDPADNKLKVRGQGGTITPLANP